MKYECTNDVDIDWGDRVFTKGEIYLFEEFNIHDDGTKSYITINDLREEHLIGHLNHEFVRQNFKTI
jgi:hypothetical protein